MNCEKCGRPLKENEERFCPNCNNKRDKNSKTARTIGGGVLLAGLGTGLGLLIKSILGGKSKK
jgi:hypothetical protein